jgi:tetratricopeptide (TPR) repeat protein
MNRRQFLISAAALSVTAPVFAEEPRHPAPPYLAFKKFIAPGNDEFAGEGAAAKLKEALHQAVAAKELPDNVKLGSSPTAWKEWIESLGVIRRVQFFPLPENFVRYEAAGQRDGQLLYRVGRWKHAFSAERLDSLTPIEEHTATAEKTFFRDVTAAAFKGEASFAEQLSRGIPYWRARLDLATGIDLYGSNGIAVGDVDGDGNDEIYVCQPGGLPNKLYKFREDGTLTDITDVWQVGILDDTSCALFLDLRNSGRQDLVVLRAGGPELFINEGKTFRQRRDGFLFQTPPQGGFTGMAAADFDRDGKLDLYLCTYVYFQNEAQYTYATPYHDAQNGPPNFLFRNQLNTDGSGVLQDFTTETGLQENNNRFSFAPAWCDYNGDGWPDLYVANDFGRKNLYVNRGGHFRDLAASAGVEDIGPGMSAAWFDYDGDGHPDLYVANMWTDAGQRIIHEKTFGPANAIEAKDAYRRHTMGNSLFRNRADGTFEDATFKQQVQFGRWAWSADGIDLDNDGQNEIFVTCGMLTNESTTDLNSFFWRQVVAHSPVTAQPSAAYESGWNSINQFIREDYSWNGREPNVLHVRRGDRYFDYSGVSGLDFADDSRAFAVTDFDGDGRPDIIVKNRLGPQVRILQNDCGGANRSIAFVLRGTKSNRDAIGARVQVDGQTKWLSAGSGFLSQHTKRLIFGIGAAESVKHVQIIWPSGTVQELGALTAGHTYSVVEGLDKIDAKPFREARPLPTGEVLSNNKLELQDTWFMEPVPLPEPQRGPGLFVLKERTEVYEIFRRYLFDWRTTLVLPLALLLNADGHAVKIYAAVPSAQQVQADLAHTGSALPFAGVYLGTPHRDFFKLGAAFLQSGYSEQALPYLEKVLARTPANALVLVLVGQIHFQANRMDQAEKAFQAALAVKPSYAEAWSGLADVDEARDHLQPAGTKYDKALELKPDLIYTLLNAGRVADKLNQQTRAEAFYRRALAADPQSADAANGLGLALAKQGSADEARKLFEQAIAERRDFSGAVNNLGVLYIQQGKTNDAIAAFEYGVSVAPDDDILYLNLARVYTQMGKMDQARQVMQRLLDRKPGSTTAKHALQELNSR